MKRICAEAYEYSLKKLVRRGGDSFHLFKNPTPRDFPSEKTTSAEERALNQKQKNSLNFFEETIATANCGECRVTLGFQREIQRVLH